MISTKFTYILVLILTTGTMFPAEAKSIKDIIHQDKYIIGNISVYKPAWQPLYAPEDGFEKHSEKIAQYGPYSFYTGRDYTLAVRYKNILYSIEEKGCKLSPIEVNSGLFFLSCGDIFGPSSGVLDMKNFRILYEPAEFIQKIGNRLLLLALPTRSTIIKTLFFPPTFKEVDLKGGKSYTIKFPYPSEFYKLTADQCLSLQILSEQRSLSFSKSLKPYQRKGNKIILTPQNFGIINDYKKCHLGFMYDPEKKMGIYFK